MLYPYERLHVLGLRNELKRFLSEGSFAALMQKSIGTHVDYMLFDEGEDSYSAFDPVGAITDWSSAEGGAFDTEWLESVDGGYLCDNGDTLPADVKHEFSVIELLAAYGIWLVNDEIYSRGDVPDEGVNESFFNHEQVIEHRSACLITAYQALMFCNRFSKGEGRTEKEEEERQLNFQKFASRVNGKKGGDKAAERLKPLRDFAVTKYHSKKWPSPNKASIDLKDEVVAYGETIGLRLAKDNAQRTIYGWLLLNPPSV